jgi:hypothetical protein
MNTTIEHERGPKRCLGLRRRLRVRYPVIRSNAVRKASRAVGSCNAREPEPPRGAIAATLTLTEEV